MKKEPTQDVITNETLPKTSLCAAALTEREAAAYLNVSPQFLRLSRHYGIRPGYAAGPIFVRLGGGRSIRYLKSDLDAWLQAHRCHPTSFSTEI